VYFKKENMKNKKIILAGGTGFIGQALTARWGKDNQVIILSRQSAGAQNNSYKRKLLSAADGYHITYWHWDGRSVEKHWANALEGADLVINLAGRSVNCRYTPRNKQEIFDSRTDATRAIGQAIREAVVPPKLWINAASATIYRHAQDRPQDEYTGDITDHRSVARRADISDVTAKGHISGKDQSRHFKDDFSVLVCKRWEKTFEEQRTPFTRKVALRIAITLGEGGVIIPYLRLLKLGLGGRQGSGRQMYSWVHIEDLGRAAEWFLDHPELEGVYNVAAPGPVTNAYFMSALRRLTGHRLGLPAPAWLLKIGAVVIGTETELVLKSRWVVPTKLQETGFVFKYAQVDAALRSIIRKL
jgi:NAD dependent epimerase/dehydratase family enzyme